MSLESFYGGRQGISPVIRNSFQYVDVNDPAYLAAIKAATPEGGSISPDDKKKIDNMTMDIVLADSNYEDVWYNELCIIDTKNKANKNNGKLYRRTLKGRGDNDLPNRSAEYIGQIVGPAGANPFMAFKSLAGVKAKANDDNYTVNDNTIINWPNSEASTSSEKPDEIDPFVFKANIDNKMIVPGKYKDEDGEDQYNDSIRYTWFNIVDNTTENATQSMIYLGFEIPYPSLDLAVTNVDWDEEAKIIKDSGTGYDDHPFYHSWKMNIPRGVRGNAAGNIRMAQYKDFRNLGGDSSKPFLYDFKNAVTEVNTKRGTFIVKEITPSIFEDETEEQLTAHQNVPFWVYDYTFYDKAATSTASIKPYTFYLGSYKEIKDINFDEHGTVTFIYSDTTEKEFSQKVQWVKEVSIADSGIITFIYNTIDENEQSITYTKQLPFPDHLEISDQGKITVYLKSDNNLISLPLKTSWENKDLFDLNYFNTIELDEDTKVLSYTTYPKNNGSMLNDGEGLNYIKAMTIDENYHLLAYYGSSQFRPTQEDIEAGEKDGKPITINNQSTNGNVVIWKGQTFRDGIIYPDIPQGAYWQDFGLMRQISQGIRVLSEFDLTNYPNKSALPSYSMQQFIEEVLNPKYWDDDQTIENPYYNGKIGNEVDYNGDPLRGTFCYTTEVANGSAYYYDYDAHSWKYAGTWGESNTSDVQIDNVSLGNKTLSNTGILFKERISKTKANLLPILWPTD